MIEYLPGGEPRTSGTIASVEYVAGPKAGRREPLSSPPETLIAPGGVYRRSVACADDGALRYVWQPADHSDPGEGQETIDDGR